MRFFVNSDNGVDTVVGFELSVWQNETAPWTRWFFHELRYGETVENSCVYAANYVLEKVRSDARTPSYYIAGNKNRCFV